MNQTTACIINLHPYVRLPDKQKTTLHLKRSPVFLRVVVDSYNNVDALDLPEDTPSPAETMYAFKQNGDGGAAIYCSRGKGCRTESFAYYDHYPTQPPQETMRDWNLWAAWCEEQKAIQQTEGE